MVSAVMLTGAVIYRPRGFTLLETPGNYAVYHGRQVTVFGAVRGGEHDLLRYLDRRGVTQFDLVLTQPVRLIDAPRLANILPRVRTIYFYNEKTTIERSLFYETLAEASRLSGAYAGRGLVFAEPPVEFSGSRVYIDGGYLCTAEHGAIQITWQLGRFVLRTIAR